MKKVHKNLIFYIAAVLILAGPFLLDMFGIVTSSFTWQSFMDDIMYGLSGSSYARMGNAFGSALFVCFFYFVFMFVPVAGFFAWSLCSAVLFKLPLSKKSAILGGLPISAVYTAMMYAVIFFLRKNVYALPLIPITAVGFGLGTAAEVIHFIYLRRRFGLNWWKCAVCCIVPLVIFIAWSGFFGILWSLFCWMMSV